MTNPKPGVASDVGTLSVVGSENVAVTGPDKTKDKSPGIVSADAIPTPRNSTLQRITRIRDERFMGPPAISKSNLMTLRIVQRAFNLLIQKDLFARIQGS
jgi:hypothetical protein